MLAPSGAARSVNDRQTPAAETGKSEGRAIILQRRAERAEAEAAWHEQRAGEWAEIAAQQNALGDFAVGREPLAEFNANKHRQQTTRKLQRAKRLRQELSRILHQRHPIEPQTSRVR